MSSWSFLRSCVCLVEWEFHAPGEMGAGDFAVVGLGVDDVFPFGSACADDDRLVVDEVSCFYECLVFGHNHVAGMRLADVCGYPAPLLARAKLVAERGGADADVFECVVQGEES